MKLILKYFYVLFFLLCHTSYSFAMSIIQDDEIEEAICHIIRPIFKAAKLQGPFNIHIVNNKDINAFVTGVNDVFIHSGLLVFAKDDPTILAGVMAHEFAHIAQQHVSLKISESYKIKQSYLTGAILGTIAGVLSRNPAVGAAVLDSKVTNSIADFIQYNRIHEHAADKLAVQYLSSMGMNISGLLKLFIELEKIERGFTDMPVYFRTHPLSQERIHYLTQYKGQGKDSIYNAQITKHYKIAMNKLYAFIAPPHQLIALYKTESEQDRYVKAIAFYRKHNFSKSFKYIDSLIKAYPANSYYHELKALFSYERGDLDQAIESYKQAILLNTNSMLLKISLSDALIAKEQELEQVISMMRTIIEINDNNIKAWYNLGLAFGKLQYQRSYYLAFAIKHVLTHDYVTAKKFLATSDSFTQTKHSDFNKKMKELISTLLAKSN